MLMLPELFSVVLQEEMCCSTIDRNSNKAGKRIQRTKRTLPPLSPPLPPLPPPRPPPPPLPPHLMGMLVTNEEEQRLEVQ